MLCFGVVRMGNGVVQFVIPNFVVSCTFGFYCKSSVIWRAVRIAAHELRIAIFGCVLRVRIGSAVGAA